MQRSQTETIGLVLNGEALGVHDHPRLPTQLFIRPRIVVKVNVSMAA
ncbi:hypothetical protein PSYMO_32719 [Pseudomonas amygdali pv. mori str. 301020]|uniref:Uncharacterized protein n=1 Tax=Pseudomonas amygdali pv. mori str. 301020 TaxID=629261 RepID=A0A656GJX6_PSEA0|nr:hypothetical protein PSYMO_32719 [Pseudomonas amygdali pv. mori str. 301020]